MTVTWLSSLRPSFCAEVKRWGRGRGLAHAEPASRGAGPSLPGPSLSSGSVRKRPCDDGSGTRGTNLCVQDQLYLVYAGETEGERKRVNMLMGLISGGRESFCFTCIFKFQCTKYNQTRAGSGIALASCQALFQFLFIYLFFGHTGSLLLLHRLSLAASTRAGLPFFVMVAALVAEAQALGVWAQQLQL